MRAPWYWPMWATTRAPVARATGAPVYCPEIEVPILADIMAFVPWEGFGPFESYDADETVRVLMSH